MIVIRRLVVSLLLYGLLVWLLWFDLSWGPMRAYTTGNGELELILVCFVALATAIALMLLRGFGAFKFLFIAASGAYFGSNAGLPTYLTWGPPISPAPGPLIIAICAIAVGTTILRWLVALGLRRSGRISGWTEALDVRQGGVLRAGFTTVVWIVVFAFWAPLHEKEPNPLDWMPANIGFVLLFFVYECLRSGGISEAPIPQDQPAITFLSCEEADRVRAGISGGRLSGSPAEEPQADAHSA